MESLVSIIIPTYNRPKIVLRAVTSVLNQTHKTIEVIVIDDCSDDNGMTEYNLRKINDERLVYYKNLHRTNGAYSRNKGIELAKGKFISFLDSDDSWHEKKIEKCLGNIHSENKIIYTRYQKLGMQKGIFPAKGKLADEKACDYLLVNNGAMQTSTLFMHANIAKSVRFDDSLVRFQDYDFIIRAESQGYEFEYLNDILTNHYDDDQEGRISNSYAYQPAADWIEKISPIITNEARCTFIVNRVVKYMIFSNKRVLAMKTLLNLEIYKTCNKYLYFKRFALIFMPYGLGRILKTTRWILRITGFNSNNDYGINNR